MNRIASLREKALEPDLSWNLFRLHFLQRCEENRCLDERMLRYADSYTYAMGKMEPRIEEEELIDIEEVKQNIANIEAELAEVQAQMKKYMEELGL